ncbi:MAG: ribulose-phosphate 3-epimerase, partial [Devosia sp.]|nr:ribulose-phosphate 3-epimerase [Devosia sp.]
PNISFGAAVMGSIRSITTKPFDVHLMIAPVDPYLAAFASAGADIITVHAEAGPHLHRTLQAIRGLGVKAGVAINPATPVAALEPVIDDVDLILVMSVNPGFGGQSFIPSTLPRLRQARALIGQRPIDLEVDGGITADNVRAVAEAGANVFVAGSSIYGGNDAATYAARITAIRNAASTLRA